MMHVILFISCWKCLLKNSVPYQSVIFVALSFLWVWNRMLSWPPFLSYSSTDEPKHTYWRHLCKSVKLYIIVSFECADMSTRSAWNCTSFPYTTTLLRLYLTGAVLCNVYASWAANQSVTSLSDCNTIGYTTSRYWRNFTHITIFFSIT